MNKKHILYLFIILCIAGYFRFVGINWDQNQHLHPDERFLTMVATGLSWPKSIHEYFDTATSPVNPHNRGFSFYVYGTWPVLLVKWVAERVHMDSYDGIPIIGRICSGTIELLMVLLVYIKTLFMSKKTSAGLIAAFLYACMILPIQLSHFFAVDPYITFFLTASFLILILMVQTKRTSTRLFFSICLGVTFGLAVSAKISGVLFVVVIACTYILMLLKKQGVLHLITSGIIFGVFFFITLRIFYPYVFTGTVIPHINPLLIANWKQLKSFDGINTGFPPALQWIPTVDSLFFPLQTYLWGFGIPIGTFVCGISLLFLLRIIQKKYVQPEFFLAFVWILLLFSYQSIQFAKALRYVYPVYPIIAVLTGIISISLLEKIRQQKWRLFIACLSSFFILWWAWGFTNIYRAPHTRIQASYWIYDNIRPGSRLTYELWDDAVPVNFKNDSSSIYDIEGLPMYDPDSQKKWKIITSILENSDYITLTSNRLWRSLSALPNRFPNTARYYELLLSGSLGFTNVVTFTSYPCLIPGSSEMLQIKTNLHPPPFSFATSSNCLLSLNDDGAEESFTVYDHPKVLLFKKTTVYTKDQLFQLIYGQQQSTNILR